MVEYRSGGRRVSQQEFFRNMQKKAIDIALNALADKVHGVASAIVDPATGKHADTFVRRHGTTIMISTQGSPDFARELERRLGVETGSIKSVSSEQPNIYLAHASEDHDALAKPLAEKLMAAGIEVWLDGWEIRSGDSLKRKMEEGLDTCTHFVVLLTPRSLGKPWVETEIDAGFMRAVEGKSKFIGLRVGVPVGSLSAFLQTRHCPELAPDNDAQLSALIADIYGASRKPPLGAAPHYVKTVPPGLSGWSPSACAVAEFLVRHSDEGVKFDPEVSPETVATATGLPIEDIRLGALDLIEAGLVEETRVMGEDDFYPLAALFVEFDRHFLDFNSRDDGAALVNRVLSENRTSIAISELAKQFPDWPKRRLNSALNYLEAARIIDAERFLDGGGYTMSELNVTNRTRRFARDQR